MSCFKIRIEILKKKEFKNRNKELGVADLM